MDSILDGIQDKHFEITNIVKSCLRNPCYGREAFLFFDSEESSLKLLTKKSYGYCSRIPWSIYFHKDGDYKANWVDFSKGPLSCLNNSQDI